MSIPRQRILVTIANFGTKNDRYLHRLLDAYRTMPHDVHVVVISNVQKELPEHCSLRIEIPTGDPWSFPFVHKQILAEKVNDYDLFIYSEDDTLITAENIEAFLSAQAKLMDDEIAGFLRWEMGADGYRHYSSIHSHFHWDPKSVVTRGGELFAEFTNHHAACYVMTQAQLQRAIASGGYLVGPHQNPYDLLVTAATDPYTQCGMKKLLCISRMDDFVLPHLPNKYVGEMGLREDDLRIQLRAMREIAAGERPAVELMQERMSTRLAGTTKSYYEAARPDVLEWMTPSVRSVLSFACGWGEQEAALQERGIHVTAVPLDAVIGACAEARGIEVLYGGQDAVLQQLSGRMFDCILLSNVLHIASAPEALLARLTALLKPGGKIVAVSPNYSHTRRRLRSLLRRKRINEIPQSGSVAALQVTPQTLTRWFRRAHLSVRKVVPNSSAHSRLLKLPAPNFLRTLLSEDITILACKPS